MSTYLTLHSRLVIRFCKSLTPVSVEHSEIPRPTCNSAKVGISTPRAAQTARCVFGQDAEDKHRNTAEWAAAFVWIESFAPSAARTQGMCRSHQRGVHHRLSMRLLCTAYYSHVVSDTHNVPPHVRNLTRALHQSKLAVCKSPAGSPKPGDDVRANSLDREKNTLYYATRSFKTPFEEF